MSYQEEDDDEGPDDADLSADADDSNSSETQPCPYCHKQVYEQAEWCPHCGNYISTEDEKVSSRKPLWIVIGVIIAVTVILLCWVL